MSISRTLRVASTVAHPVMARVVTVPLAGTSTVMVMTSAPIAARLVMVPAAVIARQGNTSIRACDEPCLA